MCFGGWALTFQRNLLPPCALKGEAADPSETLAKIQAYYNFINANWNVFIFTLRELGRDMEASCLHEAFVATDTLSNSTHVVNYMFSSDSRDRPVSERLSYGVDDQISIPDTCRIFLFS
jgi:hypothetical protein